MKEKGRMGGRERVNKRGRGIRRERERKEGGKVRIDTVSLTAAVIVWFRVNCCER